MYLEEKNTNRLVIYFIYDKEGIVDDYILYMLDDLKKNASEIAVVCNGKITPESRQKLLQVTPILIVRDNKGMDVWAYKTALDYYGWDGLKKFDEIVMMNFTIMGPVYPLEEMFTEMSSRDLDFWGITMYHKYEEGDPFGTIELGYIPDHIQSHFIAVRSSMFNSIEFQMYWDNMGEISDYRDAVGCHEAMFTYRFAQKGFKWDVYADMGDTYNNHPVLMAPKEMIIEHRCPIFKRRSFMHNYANVINDTVGASGRELLEYLDKYTDYDTDMIWQNILRLENQADIKKNLQLNYICSENEGTDISKVLREKKMALVLHFYFEDLADYCLRYVSAMPAEADIYVTVGSEKKKQLIEKKFSVLPNKVEVILIENRGRDVSALLVATKSFIMDYDYVCFVHDKKVTQLLPETVGAGFSYKCFENLLASKEFVSNVIDTFEKNPRLGLLTPPPPNHGQYFITLGHEWGTNYEKTVELAGDLGLTVPISEDKEPIAPLGTMFWFRPKAMKLLFDQDWEYEDFPEEPNNIDGTLLHACERIYSYVVQQEGYYPAWVFSQKGAALEITNLNYMVRMENAVIIENSVGMGKLAEVVNNTSKAFAEWNDFKMMYGLEHTIYRTKLFLGVNGVISEKNAVETTVETKDNEIEVTYTFDDLNDFGCISMLRWDPGEASGVTIQDLTFHIYHMSGIVEKKTLKSVTHNGQKVDNRILFITDDPQLYTDLDMSDNLEKVVITGTLSLGISESDAELIAANMLTINNKKRIRKIKGAVKRLVKHDG